MTSESVHPLDELRKSLEAELFRLRARATEIADAISEKEAQLTALEQFLPAGHPVANGAGTGAVDGELSGV